MAPKSQNRIRAHFIHRHRHVYMSV